MLQNRATLKQTRFFLLNELRQHYRENESESITRLTLEHAGYPLSACLLEPDKITPSSVIAQINLVISEIHLGKPIQYILGQTQFCELTIKVDENVLIPRPETEAMVYLIQSEGSLKFSRIIDLGTGSGCLALALKDFYPDAEVTGLDISKKAISVARKNSQLNNLEVQWLEGDLLSANLLPSNELYDLIVSNPPYVMESEKEFMEDHVLKHEPGSALFVKDENPLLFYEAILKFCNLHLVPGGNLWLEINESLGSATAQLFKNEGYQQVQIRKDIHDKERYIHARK